MDSGTCSRHLNFSDLTVGTHAEKKAESGTHRYSVLSRNPFQSSGFPDFRGLVLRGSGSAEHRPINLRPQIPGPVQGKNLESDASQNHPPPFDAAKNRLSLWIKWYNHVSIKSLAQIRSALIHLQSHRYSIRRQFVIIQFFCAEDSMMSNHNAITCFFLPFLEDFF